MRTDLDEKTIADGLADRAQTLDVPVPRWNAVEAGMRRVRRRRRARRAAGVTAALTAVVLAAAGVQGGVLPYPTWAPAVVMPASGEASTLSSQPTKGSLADDEEWLAALREQVAGWRQDESGGESWSVGDPDDVAVLFAGDVEGHRLAAVEAPLRWGVIEAPHQMWFVGPEGAAPDEMVEGGSGSPSDVLTHQFGPDLGYPGAGAHSGWLVVTAGPRDVTLLGPPEYSADGSVSRQTSVLEEVEPGVYVWSSPEEVGAVTLAVDGRETAWSGGTGEPPSATEVVRAAVAPSQSVTEAFSLLYATAGLPTDAADPVVLWSGGPAERRTAVLALRTESGALVVGSGHEEDQSGQGDVWFAFDAVRIHAAGYPLELATAWQQSRIRWSDDEQGRSGTQEPSDWVGVMGPEGVVTAELIDLAGAVVGRVPLEEGGAAVEAPGAADVRFLDEAGRVVHQTGVVPWVEDPLGFPLWQD